MAACVKRAVAMFGSEVALVHVCDLASHNGFELYFRHPQEIADEHWGIARRRLDSFLESEFPLAECPRILRSGEAAAQIAEVARAGEFDLIVMPTHAGRFRQMLLGSTTAKVPNDADSMVMTTRHAEAIAPRPLEHREWVCAIGLSADSERVLRLANRAARQVGAKLRVIHAIYGSPAEPFELGDDEQLDSAEQEEVRRRLHDLLKTVGCEANVRIAIGPVKQALIDGVRRSGADALIIGRTLQSSTSGRMRDLTYGVVRDSPVPVLSV
jgi:nucleotide-binding universal stress UspA family protein